MTVIEAITEEQAHIIAKGENPRYPFAESISDIDLIASLTELKIRLKREEGDINEC